VWRSLALTGREYKETEMNARKVLNSVLVLVLLAAMLPLSGATASQLASAPGTWAPTGSLHTARYYHTATLLPNGKVLVTGGCDEWHTCSNGSFASAELYDPATGVWSVTGSLNHQRALHTATLLPDGKVLVAGGYGGNGQSVLTSAELYDSATGAWSVTGNLNTAHSSHSATLLSNGQVLVVGGGNGSSISANAELYNPATGVWITTGSMNHVRELHTATLLPDGRVLVTGGCEGGTWCTDNSMATAELYYPGTGAWISTGNLNAGRYGHTATLLPDGRILVAGGHNASSWLTSAELYDPTTETWSATGSLAITRVYHTATLLPNGQVLVAGGNNATSGGSITGAELYNPATETWSATGSLSTARCAHTATLLPNSQVLVAGGGGHDVPATSSAELYTPAAMLDITLFAGDTPGSLPTQYEPLHQELRQSAQADPTKTIVGVFDLDGPSDTHIIVFQGATETLITGLPDATGTLSATLREYNMTAAADLGGFLKWALATYAPGDTSPGDIPVAVHYIGHGNFLAPVLDDLSRVFPTLTRSAASAANSIFPLPSRIDSNPNLTDEHPRALFAPQALADALNFATGGQRRIAVLDLVHCYAGALEELYSLAPYADRLLASPFYTYWSPEMTGAALAALHGAQTPQQMADAILSAYHQTLLSADDPSTTWNDHPHLLIALDPAGMENLKNAWDHVSDYILQAWSAPSTRVRLLAAYQAAPVYDTTFCTGDFACAAPDALADFPRFAEAVADQFQDNLSVALWASTAAQQADSMITARYAANGQPWFAAPQTPSWNFDNARGLALFTPFEADDHYLPWQIRWYTDATNNGENPNPLDWTIDTHWDEVIESYWTGDTSVETEVCLPELPGILQSGDVSALRVTAPMIGTVTLHTPARPKGVIRAGDAVAGIQVRFTIQQGGRPVYTNTVAVDYLPAGAQVEVSASQDWSPTVAETYTLTLTVDPNDQILETNENDNAVTRSDQVLTWTPSRPVVTATVSGGLQWVVSNTVALDVQSSQSPADLVIQVYQYPATLTPTVQAVSPAPVYLKTVSHVTLPLSAWNFTIPAATLRPGPVVLHIWGATSNGPSVSPAIVTFNYAPPATPLGTGAAHYFLLNLNQNDTVHFNLTANSGDPNLFGWRPANYGAPNWQGTAVGSDSLDIAPAPFTGEYLFEVYGQTAGSYTLAFTRNDAPGLRHTASTGDPNPAAYLPTMRPYFLDPIPEIPRTSRYLTYLPRIAR
jgi:hypothetical protein